VKVIIPAAIEPEITEILQRHDPAEGDALGEASSTPELH